MRTVGFLKTSEGSNYLLCDGSEIPSSYLKLRSLMTHTPDLRDRVPQGAGVYAVNTMIEAALPNIKGSFTGDDYWHSGAFYRIASGNVNRRLEIAPGQGDTYGFNATRCSPIYKDNCTTVQPPALALNFYIKAK